MEELEDEERDRIGTTEEGPRPPKLGAIPRGLAGASYSHYASEAELVTMRIALASDHAGYRYKSLLAAHLAAQGHTVVDFGTHSEEPADYPDFVRPAAEAVASGVCDRGIVLGGSGNGEAMAANRVKGVRCAVCWNEETARLARAHNDANMVSLGQRLLSAQEVLAIVTTWLNTGFEGGRHVSRIAKLDE